MDLFKRTIADIGAIPKGLRYWMQILTRKLQRCTADKVSMLIELDYLHRVWVCLAHLTIENTRMPWNIHFGLASLGSVIPKDLRLFSRLYGTLTGKHAKVKYALVCLLKCSEMLKNIDCNRKARPKTETSQGTAYICLLVLSHSAYIGRNKLFPGV